MVRSLGCSSAQGKYFTPPLSSDRVDALIAADDLRAQPANALHTV